MHSCTIQLRACSGNPVNGHPAYRVEPLVAARSLVRLDKDNYNEEEIAEALEVRQSVVLVYRMTEISMSHIFR